MIRILFFMNRHFQIKFPGEKKGKEIDCIHLFSVALILGDPGVQAGGHPWQSGNGHNHTHRHL